MKGVIFQILSFCMCMNANHANVDRYKLCLTNLLVDFCVLNQYMQVFGSFITM